MPGITNALLAEKVNTLLTAWRNRELELQAWQSGTAVGGPYSNGTYPITNYVGTVGYYFSPAALVASVDSPKVLAIAAQVAAEAAEDGAVAAQAAAIAARDLSLSYRDAAVAARDLALSYKNFAASHEANAQSYATAAGVSAAAAAIDAASINGDVAAADADAVAAAASAAAAAASAITAATFDPALYLPLTAGTSKPLSGALQILNSADAGWNNHAEFRSVMGTAARPIYLLFHQADRWYNRLKADNGTLSYVGGVSETEGQMAASAFLEGGTALSSKYLAKAGGTLTGDVTFNGYIWVQSAQPNLWMQETDASVDNKYWRFVASGEAFYAQIFNDAISAGNTWLTVERTGVTADSVELSAGTIKIRTPYGYADIGPANSGYFHFSTDRAAFYFAQEVQFGNGARCYGTGVVMTPSGYYLDSSAGHLLRAPQGSYGSMSSYGSKNNWAGVRFDSSYQVRTLMVSATDATSGVYSESLGQWDWYWNGTTFWTNNASYSVPRCSFGAVSPILTRSTLAPTGGADGDIHYQYT